MAEIAPPSPSPSCWGRLPDHLCEEIFSFLPVSTLVSLMTVCRSWSSIIRSGTFVNFYASARRNLRDDIHFLLFANADNDHPRAAAYLPSRDRWVSLPLDLLTSSSSSPTLCCHLCCFFASGGALLFANQKNQDLHVCDIFAGATWPIPPLLALDAHNYAVGLIHEGPSEFKIVAVAVAADRSFFQVYDSAVGGWVVRGQISPRLAVISNSAYLDGVLFCLGLGPPDCLLAYDTVGGECSLVDVVMPGPSVSSPHILTHRGSLFLVGGVLDTGGDICRIVIWELDRKGRRWRDFISMPDVLFEEFRGDRRPLNHFLTVDRMGMVCFCGSPSYRPLMCDLAAGRWWWAPPCPFQIPLSRRTWCGHALMPRIEAVR